MQEGKRQVPVEACRTFVKDVVLSGWRTRDKVLDYCDRIGAADQQKAEKIQSANKEEEKKKAVVVSQRLDPYSGRSPMVTETPADLIRRLVKQERSVESVVRQRTKRIVMERCNVTIDA